MTATDLTHLRAIDMARLLGTGEISSEELVRAHLDRVDAVDGHVGAMVEVLRTEALAAGRRADEERRRGEVRGPLHGVPLTIKESLDMAGHASTLGVAARRTRTSAADAVIVREARRVGLVPIGRTNVPQLLLSHETSNPVFGRTNNPFSLAHAPGGSSGGEGAAIASGQSPLGFGTDIGGSIRVPAHFCGIAGLKPTLDRWSNVGSNGAQPGQEIVRSQSGPMARSARDVAALFAALDPVVMGESDPLVTPAPVRDVAAIDVRSLRVGYFVDDGQVASSTAVRRAVRTAADALERHGASVRPFLPPAIPDAVAMYFGAMSSDGARTATSTLEGDAMDPALDRFRKLARLGNSARRALSAGMRLTGERRAADLVDWVRERDVTAYWDLTRRVRAFRLRWMSVLRDERIDVLLCPAHATPAVPHGLSRDFVLAGSSSMLWNLVQFPAGVVPVASVQATEVLRSGGGDRLDARAAAVDAKSLGLPVGVQVVGLPFRDEQVLAVMIAIEEGLASDPQRPRTPRSVP